MPTIDAARPGDDDEQRDRDGGREDEERRTAEEAVRARARRSMPCEPAPTRARRRQHDHPTMSTPAPRTPAGQDATTTAPRPSRVASQPTTNRAGALAALDRERATPRASGADRRPLARLCARHRRGRTSIWRDKHGRQRLVRRGRRPVRRDQRSGSGSPAGAAAADRVERVERLERTVVWMAAALAGPVRRRSTRCRTAAARWSPRRRPHGALEVLAAPGAQRPVEPDESRAVGADPVEARPAGRADDPFLVDPALAGRAVADGLDLGEEGLLGQVPLPDLADLLVRPIDL